MEVISIKTFCRIMPFDREQTLRLIQWGIPDTVVYGHRTLISRVTLQTVLERLEAAGIKCHITTFLTRVGA